MRDEVTAPRHKLSNVNLEEKIAICAVCGPVELNVRTDGVTKQCVNARREQRRINTTDGKKFNRGDYRDGENGWHGLTPKEAEDFKKDKICEICGEGDQKRLVVDHSHKTGNRRGVLCKNHNSGIGFFGDSKLTAADCIEILESAIAYLRKYDEELPHVASRNNNN